MIKTSLIVAATTLIFSGCTGVDDAITKTVDDTVSGDVSTKDIQEKDRVVIINNVNLAACAVIKNGLIANDTFKDGITLVTEMGVNCATYGKTAGDPTNIDTECSEQDLVNWLELESNGKITDLESAQGEKACVIGADI
jgi:hypothetical protein